MPWTVCPRSLVLISIVSRYIKIDKTSWTYNMLYIHWCPGQHGCIFNDIYINNHSVYKYLSGESRLSSLDHGNPDQYSSSPRPVLERACSTHGFTREKIEWDNIATERGRERQKQRDRDRERQRETDTEIKRARRDRERETERQRQDPLHPFSKGEENHVCSKISIRKINCKIIY